MPGDGGGRRHPGASSAAVWPPVDGGGLVFNAAWTLFERSRAGERAAATSRGGAREETLEGTVERIVFSGGDGEFTVARLKVDGQRARS